MQSRLPSPRDLQALIDAERTGTPFLQWRDGSGEQRILMLDPERARITVGRREHSDVPLPWDSEVSREHALVERVGEAWTLIDDGLSRNGTFVNGNRIHGRQRLHDGDRMCFGNTPLVYREPSTDETTASTASPSGQAAQKHLSEQQRKVLIALCRPVAAASSATPATNPQIAAEVFLSVDAVKAHLRILFDRFGLAELPQNEKRSRLVATVLESGILTPRDF